MSAPPELTRRERKRLEARERIVEASTELFEQQGYDATTVHEIAERADIGYGTFFQHFPTKVDVLRELSERSLRDLFETAEEVRKTPGGFAEHLVALFARAADVAYDKGPRARELFTTMMAQAYPASAVDSDSLMRNVFRDLLHEGQDAGVIRTDVSIETLGEIATGTWYSIFLGWVHFDDYPLRERATEAAKFLARSFTTSEET